MAENAKEAGFELEGEFFPWHLTDKVKDLQLIDHFAQMPPQDFFAAVEDNFDRSRTPILAAMIATSIRHAKPEWSRDKVIRFVEDLNMSTVEFFDGEDDVDEEDKPPLEPSDSQPSEDDEGTQGSSQKLSEPADTTSETSSETPPASGPLGSDTTTPSPSTENS